MFRITNFLKIPITKARAEWLERDIYKAGAVITASAIFLGNLYNGIKLTRTELGIKGLYYGCVYGTVKASYGLMSWCFPLYVMYRHYYRYEIANQTINKDILKAHYKMHFIPNSVWLSELDKSNICIQEFFRNRKIIK